jgi:hypothetical protein
LGLLFAALPLAAQRRAGNSAAPANPDAWQLAIGTSAGYADIHVVGVNSDITAFMFPAWGSSLAAFGLPIPTIPSLYMTIPIGGKMAIEPTLDLHRTQSNGPSTVFASALGARLDYALGHGFYGAAGLNALYTKATAQPGWAVLGVDFAGGYRFHFSGAWSGRFELSHNIMAKQKTFGVPPINITALSFGAMVAVR